MSTETQEVITLMEFPVASQYVESFKALKEHHNSKGVVRVGGDIARLPGYFKQWQMGDYKFRSWDM